MLQVATDLFLRFQNGQITQREMLNLADKLPSDQYQILIQTMLRSSFFEGHADESDPAQKVEERHTRRLILLLAILVFMGLVGAALFLVR